MKNAMRIYFAGPLFSTAERDFNAAVVAILRERGHEVFLPQEIEQSPERTTADLIFRHEVEAIRHSEVIVVNADGPDPDSGASWELGNAWRDKLSVVFRTDFRDINDGFPPLNLMLTQSANVVLDGKWKTAAEVADAIDKALDDLYETGAVPKGSQFR
jgi:nucleoside 2-deoxyribosyltransferase